MKANHHLRLFLLSGLVCFQNPLKCLWIITLHFFIMYIGFSHVKMYITQGQGQVALSDKIV